MKEYNICGMQQMGVGVIDIVDSWNWYMKSLVSTVKYSTTEKRLSSCFLILEVRHKKEEQSWH